MESIDILKTSQEIIKVMAEINAEKYELNYYFNNRRVRFLVTLDPEKETEGEREK